MSSKYIFVYDLEMFYGKKRCYKEFNNLEDVWFFMLENVNNKTMNYVGTYIKYSI